VVERAIPFRIMPVRPPDDRDGIVTGLGQLARLMEGMAAEIRLLRQDSLQLGRQLLGAATAPSYVAAATEARPEGLRLRMLGSLDVQWRGDAVDVPLGRKARMLLAFLAAGRPAGREKNELLGTFWPESADARAANNLSIAVHQVRTWLGGIAPAGRDMIAVRQARYALQGACRVDVEDFRDAISQGKRAVAAGDATEARRQFEDAVTTYRGEFLATEPCEEWALEVRRELATLAVEAAKWLARDAVRLRDWPRALEQAERIRAMDNLDEEAYQLLMLAHAKAGNRARAIQAYAECEDRLREGLGLAPGVLTRRLYDDIRAPGAP